MSVPRSTVLRAMTRGAMLVAVASLGAGCISLFPKADPAQLYRFGATTPQLQEIPSGEPGFGVLLMATGFDRAAAGDRILTVTGTQAAYIKDARWVTSSVALFDSALQRAFDADQGPARLVDRAEIARIDYVLKLDVRTFEARYDHGQAAAPTIVVEVHAALDRTQDRIRRGRPQLQGFRHCQRQSRGRHRRGVRPSRRRGPGRVGGMGQCAGRRLSRAVPDKLTASWQRAVSCHAPVQSSSTTMTVICVMVPSVAPAVGSSMTTSKSSVDSLTASETIGMRSVLLVSPGPIDSRTVPRAA